MINEKKRPIKSMLKTFQREQHLRKQEKNILKTRMKAMRLLSKIIPNKIIFCCLI